MMRPPLLTTLISFILLTASSALAQATGSGTGGGSTGPGAGTASGLVGDWTGFTWIVAIVAVLVVAAIWFFARRRGRV
jgi:membrane protein DedA with SNARE-associated domain